MAMSWSWDHTILGDLTNGIKVIYTAVHGGFGNKQTITIDPIKAIYSYYPGIKDPGWVPDIFQFENYPENSNIIYIQAGVDGTGAEIGIISFGI